jgi:hypothetical protein
MITGFNHNIKYKDRIFHIQTEDSGAKNPHIITHLFVGGNICATRKADYRHLLSIPDAAQLQAAVKAMMEEQHKQMLRNLIHGSYDNVANAENAHHLNGPAPLNVDAAVLASTGGSGNKGPNSTPRNAVMTAAAPPVAVAAPPPHTSKPVAIPPSAARAPARWRRLPPWTWHRLPRPRWPPRFRVPRWARRRSRWFRACPARSKP